jgi:hypothetical protein
MLLYRLLNREEPVMAKKFRKLTANSFDDALAQLKSGEKLVATNAAGSDPVGEGHVPVTSDRSFRIQTEMGHGDVYAVSD